MAVEAQVCPQCGAALQFGQGQTEVVCSYCGTTMVKAAVPGATSVEKELEAEKLVQETVGRERRLHSDGRPAIGKIVTAQTTDIFRQAVEGRGVLMSIGVEVQPDGEPPFAAETNVLVGLVAVDKYRPGTLLDLRYDPHDRTQVSIEGRHGVPSSNPEEQARKREAEEQARLAEQTGNAAAVAPAWGGPRPDGSVPVPAEFDQVTNLGPAAAVHEHQDQGVRLWPIFRTPRPKMLVLYRDGLAFHTGKHLHSWRWEEVAVIVSNSSMHSTWTTHAYTLTHSSGEKVTLDDEVKEIESAIKPIKQAVFARLLPRFAQAYGAGQALTFGPVTIHKQGGIQLDGKPYAWSAILDIKVERGRFNVTLRDSKKHEARVSAIPNIELLGQLIGLTFYEAALAYF